MRYRVLKFWNEFGKNCRIFLNDRLEESPHPLAKKAIVPTFLTRKGNKHEKEDDVKNGGCHFFNNFTFQSHLWCVWEKYSFL